MESKIEKRQTKDEVIYGIRKFKNTKSAIEAMDDVYGFGNGVVIGDESFMRELVFRISLVYARNKSGNLDDERYRLMLGLDDDVTSYLFAFNFLVYNPRNKTYYVNKVEPLDDDPKGLDFHEIQELDDDGWKMFDELWAVYNVQKNIKGLIADLDTFTEKVYGDKEIDGYFPEKFIQWMYDDDGGFVEQEIDEYGYYTVTLVNDKGEEEVKYVHELVAEAFVKNPDNLPYVRHKDGNKLNNNADNLEWTDIKPEYIKD